MKYAIVEISGRQFWLERGQYYDLNKIPTAINQKNRIKSSFTFKYWKQNFSR